MTSEPRPKYEEQPLCFTQYVWCPCDHKCEKHRNTWQWRGNEDPVFLLVEGKRFTLKPSLEYHATWQIMVSGNNSA